ncbi:MAG: transketolase C-terminal domain-containing protein [Anaerolineaceae bacterium]
MDTLNLVAPRDVIGDALVEIGKKDDSLLVLDCDLGRSTRLVPFETHFPERFIQLGSQEQNALSVATGLALAGYHPVFVCFTMFALGLPWTQIRMAAYAKVPFTIIGTHPGFDIGPDGGTHQMMEDIAIARVIPWLDVHTPSDANETRAAMRTLIGNERLNYIRIGRHPVPLHYPEEVRFTPGKADFWLNEGREVVLIAEGSMIFNTYEAARALRASGVGASAINIRSIKPLDEALLRQLAGESRLLVTVENHTVLGGLGGAVAEIVSEQGARLIRIGSRDVYGESATTDELRHKHGLDVEGILQVVQANL